MKETYHPDSEKVWNQIKEWHRNLELATYGHNEYSIETCWTQLNQRKDLWDTINPKNKLL